MTSSNNKSKTENVALGRIDLSERKKLAVYRVHLVRHSDLCTGIDGGRYGGYQHDHRQSHFLYALGIYLYPCIHDPAGHQQCRSGLPTVMNASRSFGIGGSRVIVSIIIAISMVGWFGFQANVCGNSFSQIMGTTWAFRSRYGSVLSSGGAIMLLTAVLGIGMIRYLNMVAVPLLLFGLLYGLYYGLCRWMAPLSCLLMNRSRKCPFRRA